MALELVIFDLDDTLIDFAATRREAHRELTLLLEAEGLPASALLRAHAEIDRRLFAEFEQGRITRGEYRERRFADAFDHLGHSSHRHLAPRMNRVFMDTVNDRPQLYGDARCTLEQLRARALRLAILTNGPADGQRRKIQATGLASAVDFVAIGEEIGASKPLPLAFETVLRHFDVDPADAMMIGDSPTLDYDAAVAAGLQARLLDREGLQGTDRPSIRKLDDLPAALWP